MSGAGKGDSPRPVNKKRYDENFERIFGKRPNKNVKSDEKRTDNKNNKGS